MASLGEQLSRIDGLGADDRHCLLSAARDALTATLHTKLSRLLILELNAARVEGRLGGATPFERWDDFLRQSGEDAYWRGLASHYPTLSARLDRLIGNASSAALAFAQHWVEDRTALASMTGGPPGRLLKVEFGAGDRHCGGRSVGMITFDGGSIVYKPRPLRVDVVLAGFITQLASDLGKPLNTLTPRVLDRGDHGWAERIDHAFAEDRAALEGFYGGVGQWLAIMRLLGGTDLHAENVIARGGDVAIIDCETLFTPKMPPTPSPNGAAFDIANRIASGTVLATGLLPNRSEALGFRGLDVSGVGGSNRDLTVTVQGIVDAGADYARIGEIRVDVLAGANLPSPDPMLAQVWPSVLDGFDEVSDLFRRLDAEGRLAPRLEPFEAVEVRVPVRPTESYAELGRMLWHPVSLHDEPKARARAHDLLIAMGRNVALAPDVDAVIAAEIGDLLIGDIPFFSTTASEGALCGPSGVRWLTPQNLVSGALEDWRRADLAVERQYIQNALACAYIAEKVPEVATDADAPVRQPARGGDTEARRRAATASILKRFVGTAIHGPDGTVTWIAPTQSEIGWSVRPLGPDLYGGLSGVCVLLAAYLKEMVAGRADAVAGVEALFGATLRSLARMEDKQIRDFETRALVRPPPPGGYIGIGSQISRRFLLDAMGYGELAAFDTSIRLAAGAGAA
ncbi:MAG: type 2 lanthipeptide synthetase LanM, partial [Caulobacteraceae bacterium]